MSQQTSSKNPGLRVDLIASLDGRLAELGRDLNDEELNKAEALIGLSNLMAPLGEKEGEAKLRLEDEDGVCRALILEGDIICIDLPRQGMTRGHFRARARTSLEWMVESRGGQR